MSTIYPARVFFLLARESNKAVVFRRGPTKWTQMITWDLDTDKLEYGQWTKTKFQKWRCDLSPSGKYLIYLDHQFEREYSSTNISKPPYWTAITKWKHYEPRSMGGGLFKSENSVELNWHFMLEVDELFPAPSDLNVTCKSGTPKEKLSFDIEKTRLQRDGWKLLDAKAFIENETSMQQESSLFWDGIFMDNKFQSTPNLWSKQITKSRFLYRLSYFHPNKFKRLSKFFIKRKQEVKELEEIEWAEVDYNKRIIATKKGILMASKFFKDGSVQLNNLELLHDLNAQKPIEIAVPDEMKKW